MQLGKPRRLGQTLLALYGFTAVSGAQSVSTLPAGCYWTSTVIFGNITSSTTSASLPSAPSTSGDNQIGISPILTLSTSSPVDSEPVLSSASASFPFSLSSSDGTSELTSSSTMLIPTLTSTISAGSSTTATLPVSTPFRVTVSGFKARLRARAASFVSFTGNNAFLISDENAAAIFVLRSDGQLLFGDATVGTDGNLGALPLMQFPGSTQPSGYTWVFNDTRLTFGDDLAFSALLDGQMYVTFPGSQPPAGAVQLGLEPEPVEMTTSSSSTTPSTSMEMTTTLPDITNFSTSETSEATASPSIFSTSSLPSTPGAGPATTRSPLASSQLTPDRPLTSLPSVRTTAVLPPSPSAVVSIILSSYAQAPGSSPSPAPVSGARSSTITVAGISSSMPVVSSTAIQVSPITQLFLTTRGSVVSVALSSSSSSTLVSAVVSSISVSPLATTTVSISTPATSLTTFSNSPPSSVAISSTSKAVTTLSSQLVSSSPSTTTSPAQSTTVTSSSPITTTSRTGSTSSTFNPIPTPYPAKRGLAYRNVTTLSLYPPPSPYISWSYNYYSLPNASDDVGPYSYPSSPYRFIPLLYNDAQSLTSIWPANVNFSIAHYGTDAIFGFNEPDANYDGMSANMPVQQSITGYRNFMQPFAGRVKIGAPAVTNTGGGLAYLQQFLGNATQQNQNLTLDFINIHWYASPYNIDYFKSFLLQAYNLSLVYSPNITSSFINTATGGLLPIWITEFGMDQNFYDLATNVQFMKNASLWMDEQSWVERYAWFGNFPAGPGTYGGTATNTLLNADGSRRSALGDVWYAYNGTN